MVNPFREINWHPGLPERRQFAASLMIGLPCLALTWFLGRGLFAHSWSPAPPLWIGGAGFAAGFVLWLFPAVALPFYLGCYFLSCCIGIVLGNFLLILFYYTFVTGTGLLLRLLRSTPVSKGFNKSAASYWQEAEQISDLKRYYGQF